MFATTSPSDVEPSYPGDPVSGALTASLAASGGISTGAGASVVPHAAAQRPANDENTLIHRLPCSAIMIGPFFLDFGIAKKVRLFARSIFHRCGSRTRSDR